MNAAEKIAATWDLDTIQAKRQKALGIIESEQRFINILDRAVGLKAVRTEGVYQRADGTYFAVLRSRNKGHLYAKRAVVTETAVDFEYDAEAFSSFDDTTRRLSVEEVDALSLNFVTCPECGHKLTNKATRARGIGPQCRQKLLAKQALREAIKRRTDAHEASQQHPPEPQSDESDIRVPHG